MNDQINSDYIQKSREQELSNMTYQKNELEQLADYIRSQGNKHPLPQQTKVIRK